MTKKRKLAYLALLGNVVIWGAALPIVKPALSVITPYYFLELRYIIAGLFMIPLLPFVWPEKHAWKKLGFIIPIEAVQVLLSLTFLYKGLEYTPALTASLIGSTAPIFVILGGIIFLHEHEEKREWLGLGLSVLGTLLIIFSAASLNQVALHNYAGLIFMALYQVANTAYLLLAKRHYQRENKLFITVISCLVGLIGFSFLAPLLGPTPPVALLLSIPAVVKAVLYMGILGSPIAVSLLLFGQSQIEASEASLFTYLQPLIYIPLTVFWLGDKLYPAQLLGLILIVSGVYIAESRRKQRTTKQFLF